MSVVETTLIFAGIPLLIFLILAALTIGRGPKPAGRFKMGEPWSGQPLWFVGHPRPRGGHAAAAIDADSADTVKGGASGSW